MACGRSCPLSLKLGYEIDIAIQADKHETHCIQEISQAARQRVYLVPLASSQVFVSGRPIYQASVLATHQATPSEARDQGHMTSHSPLRNPRYAFRCIAVTYRLALVSQLRIYSFVDLYR